MYLQKGQVVFQIFNTEKSWVLLNIFPSAQKMVSIGNQVIIVPEVAPERKKGPIPEVAPEKKR